MFIFQVCIDALFVRCKSRQEQVILVVLAAIIVVILIPTSGWFLGLAHASKQSVGEISPGPSKVRGGVVGMMIFGYAMYWILMLFSAIMAFVGAINLLRAVTKTGLIDPGEKW